MESETISTPECGIVRRLTGFLLGVIGPVLFLRLEYKTHCLSGCLFDPMPTRWHFVLLLVVPLAHCLSLVGMRCRQPWLRSVVHFLLWPSVIIPVYYTISVGPWLQGFGLVASTLFIGWWVLHGFTLPAGGLDSSGVELATTLTLILLPMLAVVGWYTLLPCVIRCTSGFSATRLRWLWGAGVVSVLAALVLVELPLVRTHLALKAYMKGKTNGEVPPLLMEESQVALVSRLHHAPQQFSSDGAFDCEGPVDVFGPTVRMLNGWASPTEMWKGFHELRGDTGRTLLDNVKILNPATDTSPRAWRRLSKWERWAMNHNKDSKHLRNRK